MKTIAACIVLALLFAAGTYAATVVTETHVWTATITQQAKGKAQVMTISGTITDLDTIPDPVTVTRTVTVTTQTQPPPPPPPPSSAPSAPGNLRATQIATDSFVVQWDSSVDPDGIGNYRIYLDGAFLGQGCGVHCGWTNQWTVRNLQPGTQYRLEVEAVDLLGNVGPRSGIFVTTLTPPPPPPSGNATANIWVTP